MAKRTAPSTCYRQIDENENRDAEGASTFAYILKGPYAALESFARTLKKGDNFTDATAWAADSWQLQRRPGGLGLLTVSCVPSDADGDDEEEAPETATTALDETWTLRSVRNDCSVLIYCGDGVNNPSREYIEAWQKEPDGQLADNLCFRDSNGNIVAMNEMESNRGRATAVLIGKLRKGYDTVMRFYPMLTKTRTFSKPPATVYENLATIDTPTVSELVEASGNENESASNENESASQSSSQTTPKTQKLSKPGNLSDVIAAHTWLKCQDDLQKTADGKFQRVESWIGALKPSQTASGWDVNFYGADAVDRWPVPYVYDHGPTT